MSVGARISAVVGLLVAVVAFVVWVVVALLLPTSSTVDFTTSQASGAPVNLTVQTVGSIGTGFGDHPTWVSYLVQSPSGQWIHSTIWKVPAHTRINLTIQQYDSGSPLRNQQWGAVAGTTGGTATLNGKTISVYDSNSGNGVGHTFAIPTLGINIPLVGVPSNAANICGQAPCGLTSPHNIIKASFVTPGPGNYPWQCFVPCGLGFLFGNGGPMSTVGYMGGFLNVVSS
jgi:hypothetical protein